MSGFFILTMLLLLASPAHSSDTIRRYVPNAELVGTTRFTYWFWNVYDITLYAPQGKWRNNRPYALTLSYLRTFTGKAIVERSVEEIRQLGFSNERQLQRWSIAMQRIFPDVEAGKTLTGIYRPQAATRFYQGDRLIGEVRDPEFCPWFFVIWLSKKTSEPDLRKALLGLTRSALRVFLL